MLTTAHNADLAFRQELSLSTIKSKHTSIILGTRIAEQAGNPHAYWLTKRTRLYHSNQKQTPDLAQLRLSKTHLLKTKITSLSRTAMKVSKRTIKVMCPLTMRRQMGILATMASCRMAHHWSSSPLMDLTWKTFGTGCL